MPATNPFLSNPVENNNGDQNPYHNPPRGGGGGGGIPGGSTGTVNTFVPFLENGGFAATAFLLLIPAQPSENGSNAYLGTLEPSNWNDVNSSSFYSYRMEDITPGRMPTVRRIILIYRDLGVATFTVTVSGTDDNNQMISQSQVITIGTTAATQALFTQFVDITISCFRPQLSYTRAPGAGTISIVRAGMIGDIEEVSL